MNILVLGSGMMGQAITFDIGDDGGDDGDRQQYQ